MALPQIEWVDYLMEDERQRPIRSDSGHQESLAGAFQIPEFDQFALNPAVAGVFVADDRKGHCLSA
jgi:hypothetical protein